MSETDLAQTGQDQQRPSKWKTAAKVGLLGTLTAAIGIRSLKQKLLGDDPSPLRKTAVYGATALTLMYGACGDEIDSTVKWYEQRQETVRAERIEHLEQRVDQYQSRAKDVEEAAKHVYQNLDDPVKLRIETREQTRNPNGTTTAPLTVYAEQPAECWYAPQKRTNTKAFFKTLRREEGIPLEIPENSHPLYRGQPIPVEHRELCGPNSKKGDAPRHFYHKVRQDNVLGSLRADGLSFSEGVEHIYHNKRLGNELRTAPVDEIIAVYMK